MIAGDIAGDISVGVTFVTMVMFIHPLRSQIALSLYNFAVYRCVEPFYHCTICLSLHTKLGVRILHITN